VESEAAWSDLYATAANRKRTMLACFMAFFYAFTGYVKPSEVIESDVNSINVISGYSSMLLGDLGMKPFQQIVLFAGVVSSKRQSALNPGHSLTEQPPLSATYSLDLSLIA
jgi:hypothetical protein